MYNWKIDVRRLKLFICMVIGIVLLGGACTTQERKNDTHASAITDMKGAELDTIMNDKAEKEQYLVIDVRQKHEYEAALMILKAD